MNDYDYILANIFDTSRHIMRIDIQSIYAISYKTIYEKAKNHNRECNINARLPRKNNGFEKAIYNSPIGLYYQSSSVHKVSIMEKCYRDQENMYEYYIILKERIQCESISNISKQ